MSKDCEHHTSRRRHKLIRYTLLWLAAFVVLVLLLVFIVWLVLRPTKPRFYLQDATVQQFNLTSGSNILNTVIQVTLTSHNPNDRIGIFYDRMDVYASYQSQQITLYSALPVGYQGHGDVDVWSPYLYGPNVPVAPYICSSLTQDEGAGILLLYVKIEGRIRWKVGSWTSGGYHIDVSCPAVLSFNDGNGVLQGVSPSIKFQQISTCTVDI